MKNNFFKFSELDLCATQHEIYIDIYIHTHSQTMGSMDLMNLQHIPVFYMMLIQCIQL